QLLFERVDISQNLLCSHSPRQCEKQSTGRPTTQAERRTRQHPLPLFGIDPGRQSLRSFALGYSHAAPLGRRRASSICPSPRIVSCLPRLAQKPATPAVRTNLLRPTAGFVKDSG